MLVFSLVAAFWFIVAFMIYLSLGAWVRFQNGRSPFHLKSFSYYYSVLSAFIPD
jgi:hypothetical protein